MARAASQYEVVVWKFAGVGAHYLAIEIDSLNFAEQHRDIRVTRQHGSNRRGDVGRTQAGSCDLIKKGLKQVIVPPVNQCDAEVLHSTQQLCSVVASEPAADDHNARHCTFLRVRAAWEIFSPIKVILLSRSRFSFSQYGLVISLNA